MYKINFRGVFFCVYAFPYLNAGLVTVRSNVFDSYNITW